MSSSVVIKPGSSFGFFKDSSTCVPIPRLFHKIFNPSFWTSLRTRSSNRSLGRPSLLLSSNLHSSTLFKNLFSHILLMSPASLTLKYWPSVQYEEIYRNHIGYLVIASSPHLLSLLNGAKIFRNIAFPLYVCPNKITKLSTYCNRVQWIISWVSWS